MLLNLVHGGLILAWILDQVSIVIRFAWSHAQDGAIYVLAIDTLTRLQSELAPLRSDQLARVLYVFLLLANRRVVFIGDSSCILTRP